MIVLTCDFEENLKMIVYSKNEHNEIMNLISIVCFMCTVVFLFRSSLIRCCLLEIIHTYAVPFSYKKVYPQSVVDSIAKHDFSI